MSRARRRCHSESRACQARAGEFPDCPVVHRPPGSGNPQIDSGTRDGQTLRIVLADAGDGETALGVGRKADDGFVWLVAVASGDDGIAPADVDRPGADDKHVGILHRRAGMVQQMPGNLATSLHANDQATDCGRPVARQVGEDGLRQITISNDAGPPPRGPLDIGGEAGLRIFVPGFFAVTPSNVLRIFVIDATPLLDECGDWASCCVIDNLAADVDRSGSGSDSNAWKTVGRRLGCPRQRRQWSPCRASPTHPPSH